MNEVLHYPQTWSQLIGQEVAKAQIRTAALSARKRRKPAPHLLLAHPEPGIGKTALARLAAKEARRPIVEISGAVHRNEARLIFYDMADRDVLHWDEFHQAMDGGRRNIEWLLPLLQDGVLLGPFGREEVPDIQVIASTTDAHRLPPAIVSRFARPPLVGYTTEEAARVALVMSRQLLVPERLPLPSRANAVELATAANRNPRAINRLVVTLRDLALTSRTPLHAGKGYDLAPVWALTGQTPDGLDCGAQAYLRLLLGGEMGERALAQALQETSLAATERLLLARGYLVKTRSGRTLSPAGLTRAKELSA